MALIGSLPAVGRRMGLGLLCLVAAAACAADPKPTIELKADGPANVPPEFREACGHPGAEVTTARDHVVIRKADCVLTGVIIRRAGGVALTVPVSGGVGGSGTGPDHGVSASAFVDPRTGDLTFTTHSSSAEAMPVDEADLHKQP